MSQHRSRSSSSRRDWFAASGKLDVNADLALDLMKLLDLLDGSQSRFVEWNTVVLDEAQAIKNTATKRSQAAMGLNARFRLIMTGTPLENHLGELWNLFNFINPGLLGSWDRFRERFATPIEQNNDRDARRRLKKLIQPFMLRRTKSQVLDELPSKIRQPTVLTDWGRLDR